MKNKLKLVLWGKNLELPMDYDDLEFDRYELKYDDRYKLYLYKNNKKIKEIWYWDNGNKNKYFEENYKNRKLDGKQYGWYESGKLCYMSNYKNGWRDGKQYSCLYNGALYNETYYKDGVKINK